MENQYQDQQTQQTQTQPQPQTTIPNPANTDTGMTFDSQPTQNALTVPNPTVAPPSPSPSPSADAGMTFDAQPTQTAITVPSVPPAQPTQPKTGLQRAISVIKGEDDPSGSWYPELGDELSGAIKSGANGLAGVIDLINKPRGQALETPSPEMVNDYVTAYLRWHPEATKAQAAAFVQSAIDKQHEPFSSHLTEVADWLHSAGQPSGFWENIGGIGEQAIEWMGGEGLLKLASAPAKVSEAGRLIDTAAHIKQAGQVAKVLQENPRLAGMLSIGLKASMDALKSGAGDALVTGSKNALPIAAQNYLHYEDPNQALLTGATGGVLSGGVSGLSSSIGSLSGSYANVIRAIDRASDETAVQAALQDHIRDTLGKVAADANVPAPTSPSLRDAIGELAGSVQGKAKGLYAQIDEALRTDGNTYTTNYKAFDEQLRNVRRELRQSTGIDPEADAELIEREAQLVDARQAAQELAASKGVHPGTGPAADKLYTQAKALEDLQKVIRASTIGLRPELASASATASPETVTPTLAKKLNALYDKGRLQQALSSTHADDLLRSVEIANLKAKQAEIAARNAAAIKAAAKSTASNVVKYGAVAAGVPIAGVAVKHAIQSR